MTSSKNDFSSDWIQNDEVEAPFNGESIAYPVEDDYQVGTGISKGGYNRSTMRNVMIGAAALVLAGVSIGVLLGVSGGNRSDSLISVDGNVPAPSPTADNDFTPGPTTTAAGEIAEAIYGVARKGGAEFDDVFSYQSKALAWVQTLTLPSPEIPNLTMEEQAVQLYALACIYYSTYASQNDWTDFHFGSEGALPGWFSNRGWLSDAESFCNWHGISCDESNRVSEIELATNGLTGSFPEETVYLADSLVTLDLYNNLVHNKGDEGNAWLGELTNLENLFYGTTSFEYDGVPTEIGKLTNLVEYDFSYTLYFGELPSGIWSNLNKLNFLVMEGNAYNSSLPEDLVTLPNLEYLYAGFSFLDGDLEFISKMPKIFELWLDDNPGLTGPIPTSLTSADTLVSLSLTNCELTGTIPTEIGLMTNMIQMWLYSNELTGSLPTELGDLKKMKTFNVQSNLLTGTIPDGLCDIFFPFGKLEDLEADCNVCGDTCCTCCGEACIEF